jgi:hypothetical protein
MRASQNTIFIVSSSDDILLKRSPSPQPFPPGEGVNSVMNHPGDGQKNC